VCLIHIITQIIAISFANYGETSQFSAYVVIYVTSLFYQQHTSTPAAYALFVLMYLLCEDWSTIILHVEIF
jgi:hypothetical protein